MIPLFFMTFIGCAVMAGVAGAKGDHGGMAAYVVAAIFAMLTIAIEQSDTDTPDTAEAAPATATGTES